MDLSKLEEGLLPADGEPRIKIIELRRMQAAKQNIPYFTYVDSRKTVLPSIEII